MPDVEHYSESDMAEALVKSQGVVLGAAALLRCTSQTIYNYLKRYPELEEARALGRKDGTDRAELALRGMVQDGHFAATRFALEGSREGRSRGWGTKAQVQIEVDNRQLLVNIENIRLATGAETEGDILTGLAGLLESGDIVEGEVVDG